jgi:uncharacterized protein YjdB
MHPTRRSLAGAVAIALAMSGCLDDTPVAARSPSVRATLNANVATAMAGGTVRIRVGYRTSRSPLIPLPSSPQQVTLAAGTTVVVPVTVDIGPCLKDPERPVSQVRGCQLTIELTLTDEQGNIIDSQTREAPKPAPPGTSVDFGSVTIGLRVSTITIAPTTLTMTVSQELPIAATVRDASGAVITTVPVTWNTSDATVTQFGTASGASIPVRAVKVGTATITATAGGKTSNAVAVNVVSPIPLVIRQQQGAGCVIVGQTVTLEVDTPPGAVTWSVANATIATVNATSGVVTGIVAGQTTITATSGSRIGTANVCVVGPFAVTPPSLTIMAARTTQLIVSNSLGTTISFKSNAPSIASVSETGVVHAITVGQVTLSITIVAASGTITVTIPVTVIPGSVAISPTSASAPLNGLSRFTAVVRDGDNNLLPDVSATWTIDDASIGTLSATSGPTVDVRAVKLGSTTVRATVSGTAASATFTATQPLPAVGLQKVSGDGAQCPTRSPTCSFVAKAVDVNGVPVPGASVRWSAPTSCAQPIIMTTDAFGLATASVLCTTLPVGNHTQIATLVANQQQVSFAFSLQGIILSLESVDSAGVSTYAVTSSAPAAGLTVTVQYRSGPVKDYVTFVLNRTSTPAVLTVNFNAAALPIGDYTFDITVSTTTPGLGPAVDTITFNPSSFLFMQPNARWQPTSGRAPVAPRAP